MDKEEFSIKSEIFDWLEAICIAVAAIILVFSLFFRFAEVEGSSMNPTLDSGDRLVLVNTWLSEPEKGDIIVATQPTSVNHPIIKRIIATEGDIVDIDFKTGDVFVNDKLIEEHYIKEKISGVPGRPVQFPFKVSPGHVFVMGDNRNASSDSRDEGIGEIDTRYIFGKVVLRLLPFDKFGTID